MPERSRGAQWLTVLRRWSVATGLANEARKLLSDAAWNDTAATKIASWRCFCGLEDKYPALLGVGCRYQHQGFRCSTISLDVHHTFILPAVQLHLEPMMPEPASA